MANRRALISVLVACVVASYGVVASASSSDRGRIVGGIVYSGGPRGADQTALRGGHVTARRKGAIVAHVTVREGKHFHLNLRSGTYELRATSGDAHCFAKVVTVRRSRTRHVGLVCSVR